MTQDSYECAHLTCKLLLHYLVQKAKKVIFLQQSTVNPIAIIL